MQCMQFDNSLHLQGLVLELHLSWKDFVVWVYVVKTDAGSKDVQGFT